MSIFMHDKKIRFITLQMAVIVVRHFPEDRENFDNFIGKTQWKMKRLNNFQKFDFFQKFVRNHENNYGVWGYPQRRDF